MVVVLERYRGFYIRRHEKTFPSEFPSGFDCTVVCVHCHEGMMETYVSLSDAMNLRLDNWRHGPSSWNRFYLQPAFGNGSCIEDSQKVSALAYGIRRKEKATLFENYVRDMAAEVCKKAIDSLWIETEEFLKQLS